MTTNFMSLSQRVAIIAETFSKLSNTSSTTIKQKIVKDVPDIVKDDFNFCIEVLDGRHKIGYAFAATAVNIPVNETLTLREYLAPLYEPIEKHNLSYANVYKACEKCSHYPKFVERLMNREYRLGIGKSLLQKDNLSPMLAKKFEGKIKPSSLYTVTEKLDGNRCIAYYEDGEWKFQSRSGKLMHVNFNMSGLDTSLVYDGEILSVKQTERSEIINQAIKRDINICDIHVDNLDEFRSTSGLINRHNLNKDLVYNIFDIVYDARYEQRRVMLNELIWDLRENKEIRILPTLLNTNNEELLAIKSSKMLDIVTKLGGEGLMINLGDSTYEHKRTDALLKYKKAQTMDMFVYDYELGTGKYEGQIGSLLARAYGENKVYNCKVGTGLSDDQRLHWAIHPEDIVGQVIEVAYFSLSQNKETDGTNVYSLRFPRFKMVRIDKVGTSEY